MVLEQNRIDKGDNYMISLGNPNNLTNCPVGGQWTPLQKRLKETGGYKDYHGKRIPPAENGRRDFGILQDRGKAECEMNFFFVNPVRFLQLRSAGVRADAAVAVVDPQIDILGNGQFIGMCCIVQIMG